MPKSPGEILSDPTFHALPLGEQLKVMQKVDPDFAGLSPKDQGTVIAKSRQKSLGYDKIGEKPKDEGFLPTLKKDVKAIPGALMATGTGEPGDARPPGIVPQIGAAQHEQFEKGREDFKKGEYVSGAGHTLAGAIPVVGPLAATAGEEFGSGQSGQGAAHTLEALAPSALHEIPIGEPLKALSKKLKTGYDSLSVEEKTHIERATKPLSAKALARQAEESKAAKIKESADRIRAERGGLPPRGDPAWKKLPEPKTKAPQSASPVNAELPSGRKPGPAPPPNPEPYMDKRPLPVWHGVRSNEIPPPESAPIEPATQSLSGRKPGGIQNQAASPKAKASLPEPKTKAPAGSESPVNESSKPTPGKPPADTSEAAEALQAQMLGKVLRQAKIRPDDAIKIKPEEWKIVAQQAKIDPPSEKVMRLALEHNRKLWAESQNDLQTRRAAHFAKNPKE